MAIGSQFVKDLSCALSQRRVAEGMAMLDDAEGILGHAASRAILRLPSCFY